MYEAYLRDLLAPLGIYDLSEGSVSGAAVCALGAGLDAVAEQLAGINEQLAARNRRSRRIWRATEAM